MNKLITNYVDNFSPIRSNLGTRVFRGPWDKCSDMKTELKIVLLNIASKNKLTRYVPTLFSIPSPNPAYFIP